MFDRVYLKIGSGPIAGCQPLSISLISSIYALPAFPERSIQDTLAKHLDGTPWAQSFTIAPEYTATTVIAMLGDLMLSTVDLDARKIDLAVLTQGERPRLHLEAKVDPGRAVPEILPTEIKTLQAFLDCTSADAVQNVQVK